MGGELLVGLVGFLVLIGLFGAMSASAAETKRLQEKQRAAREKAEAQEQARLTREKEREERLASKAAEKEQRDWDKKESKYVDQIARLETENTTNRERIERLGREIAALAKRASDAEAQRDNRAIIAASELKRLTTEKEVAQADVQNVRALLEQIEDVLEEREFELYPRVYPDESSEQLKARMRDIRARQATLRKEGKIVVWSNRLVHDSSTPADRRRFKAVMRLGRLALEGAVDTLLENVKASNVTRLEKQFDTIVADLNRLLAVLDCSIGNAYLATVREALFLQAEYLQQVEAEKAEQRAIREQMREEAAAVREAEKAQRDAEREELKATKELVKAQEAAARAQAADNEEDRLKWQQRIAELESALSEAHTRKDRAVAMAQLTKTGHVYVVSNLGSFGESVFKIGMTRRLDPEDRIDELSDASVPFDFDVHAMIRSDDCPALEAALHRRFADRRLNLVNLRKEFFHVSAAEIREVLEGLGLDVRFTLMADATEYRQSQSLRNGVAAPVLSIVEDDEGTAEPDEDDDLESPDDLANQEQKSA